MDKIICIGKNYLNHVVEMGGEEAPKDPIVFFKPPSAIFRLGDYEKLKLPKDLGEIHHELELVFKINVSQGETRLCAWSIGLDLTARTLQSTLKKEGLPWERAKAFPNSAVTGEFVPIPEETYLDIPFEFIVNGELRQRGFGRDMIFKPNALLKKIAPHFLICDGDLLFTGTPAGVGPLVAGDRLEIRLGELLTHHLLIE